MSLDALKQKIADKTAAATSSQTFNKKFEEIKKKEVLPTTRKVMLIYESCCGCGCKDVKIERTVPYDSYLQNGDRISRVERTDRTLDS